MMDAYSSGAPNNRKVCTKLIPGHGNRQQSPSPYELTLYQIDDNTIGINLETSSQVTFAGFIVQSRDLNDNNQIIDGHFNETDNNSQVISCQNHPTWTHNNGEPKTKVSSVWSPKTQNFNGAIQFVATVVQVKQAYWDNIRSQPLFYLNGKITDDESFNRFDSLSSRAETFKESIDSLNYEQCQNKICLGLGADNNCLMKRSCQALLTVFKNNQGENEFEIQAKPSVTQQANTNIYYAMAFSEDDKMGDDLVVDCLVDHSGNVRVALSHNVDKSNNPLSLKDDPNFESILTESQGTYLDGFTRCYWKMNQNFKIPNKEYDLRKPYFIFLANGQLDNGLKEYHDIKVKTSSPVDLASTGSLEIKDLSVLIRIHGSFMLAAWFGTVPIAMILARYFKKAWPDSTLCGVKIWFAFHRSLMIFSLCLMFTAQICIFYYLGEYRIGLHQILGSIAFTLAILQPIGALCRPHPTSSKRWIFNWMHWLGGNAAHIAAASAILLATKLKLANLTDSFLYIAIVWILCHVILHLVFQVHSCCTSDTKTRDIPMQDMRHRQMYLEHDQSSGFGFHYFLLAFYIILIAFLVSILIVFVAFPNMVKDIL